MKSKKKVLGVLNGSLVGAGNNLFYFFKGSSLKKKAWETCSTQWARKSVQAAIYYKKVLNRKLN